MDDEQLLALQRAKHNTSIARALKCVIEQWREENRGMMNIIISR